MKTLADIHDLVLKESRNYSFKGFLALIQLSDVCMPSFLFVNQLNASSKYEKHTQGNSLFEVLWLCLYLLVRGYKMAEKNTKRQE